MRKTHEMSHSRLHNIWFSMRQRCEKLLSLSLSLSLSLYAKEGATVYDPFIGSGTTAVAYARMGLSCIGSEISKAQCAYAEGRLVAYRSDWLDRLLEVDV